MSEVMEVPVYWCEGCAVVQYDWNVCEECLAEMAQIGVVDFALE